MLNIKKVYRKHNVLVFIMSHSLQLFMKRKYSFSSRPSIQLLIKCSMLDPLFTFLGSVFVLLGVTL